MVSPPLGLILRSPPGWVLPGAALDVDFAQSRAFANGGATSPSALLSCTRAQTVSSYALNSAGLYVPFAANQLRIADLGLLIEQASTNTTLYNTAFTNAAWGLTTGGTASAPVVADNYATAPDGTSAAARIQFALNGGTTSSDHSALHQEHSYADSATRTHSIFMRSNTGSSYTLYLRMNGVIQTISVTPTWTRFTATGSSGSDGTASFGLRGNLGTSDSADVLAYWDQVEAATFATSPIPTTSASVTRAADVITLQGAALAAFLAGKTFLVKALFTPLASAQVFEGAGPSGLSMGAATTPNRPRPILRTGGAGRGDFNNGDGPTYSVGQAARFGVSYDGATALASNGGTTMVNSATPAQSDWAAPVYIGSRGGSSLFWHQPVQRLVVLPNNIGQAQLNALVAAL